MFCGNLNIFLAHLSRRLKGELIVYPWSGVRPSVVVRRSQFQTSSSLKPLGQSRENPVLIFVCTRPLAKVKRCHRQYSLTLINSIRCLLLPTFCNSFWKTHCFHFFLQKSLCYQIWPCRKIGQGQPRVIIWSNYDGLESPMLHTMFRGNRSTSFGEDFWRVFTIYGRGSHLGHVTQMPRTNFRSPYARRLHIKFGFDWPSNFREEDV